MLDIGYKVGLVSEERYQKFLKKKKSIEEDMARVRATIISPTKEVNDFLKRYNSSELTTGASLEDLVKRTELTYEGLKEIDPNRPELA